MNPVSTIKRSQKESVLFREISELLAAEKLENHALRDISITKTVLSADKGLCTVYFYTPQAERAKELLDLLICYKPSLRKALAERIESRYVPDIVFRFDKQYIKQKHIEELLDKVAAQDITTQDRAETDES